MGLFSKRNNKENPEEILPVERSINFGLGFNGISSYASSKPMKLSAVYCAVNQISNACALLPINVVEYDGKTRRVIKHSLTDILNKRPNQRYSHFNMVKLMIEAVLLRGNAYAYILRDQNLNVKELQLINPDYVTPVPQPDGSMKYLVQGMREAIDGVNMLHFYMHTDSNMNGISTIRYASETLAGASDAEKHSNNFFKSGANLSGIIKASATLTNDQKNQIREAWQSAFNNNGGNQVSVAILPQGLDYQSVSISPQDSQLLESRAFNVIEIARWFCIPPSKLMVMDQESYNSMEMAQLLYLQDTIFPYVEMMEEELNRKLFKPSELEKFSVDFDFDTLLETDKKSLASYYKEMLVNGIMSINEVRAKLNLEPVENGEEHIMQLSYTTLKNIVSGALIKGKEEGTEQTQGQGQSVDNKVKSE